MTARQGWSPASSLGAVPEHFAKQVTRSFRLSDGQAANRLEALSIVRPEIRREARFPPSSRVPIPEFFRTIAKPVGPAHEHCAGPPAQWLAVTTCSFRDICRSARLWEQGSHCLLSRPEFSLSHKVLRRCASLAGQCVSFPGSCPFEYRRRQ